MTCGEGGGDCDGSGHGGGSVRGWGSLAREKPPKQLLTPLTLAT